MPRELFMSKSINQNQIKMSAKDYETLHCYSVCCKFVTHCIALKAQDDI